MSKNTPAAPPLVNLNCEALAAVSASTIGHHQDNAEDFRNGTKDHEVSLKEWHRLLAEGGFMTPANLEGKGAIDDGGQADIAAIRYTQAQIQGWVSHGMPMDAVYLEAVRR